jgi:flagellar biosynthesis protein FlhF
MKIKRFIDTDMRHVLRRVREEQGPDAVILSNRRVDGGIEVITAVDYDEALVQQALGSDVDFSEFDTDLPAASESSANSTNEKASSVEVLSADLRHADEVEEQSRRVNAPDDDGLQEPSIVQMQSDISSLRDLLETQLSGLVWKDKSRRSPKQAQMLRNLSRLGLAPDIAGTIVNRTAPVDNQKALWREPLVTLTQTIPIAEDELLTKGGVAALIGPTGVGKTTTIAKMAARYAMEYGSDDIALVCADAYRIGAKEHLMAFANIIGTKVHAASTPDEMTLLLERLKGKKLVLVDTEGVSQRDIDLSARLAAFGSNADRISFYLTLSAASQESGLDETIRRFSNVPLAGAIVTKIDEAGQLGCIMSALIRHNLPMTFLSDGQRIPDDLHRAQKKRLWLVNQAVECMEASDPQINERIMAENYTEVSTANA